MILAEVKGVTCRTLGKGQRRKLRMKRETRKKMRAAMKEVNAEAIESWRSEVRPHSERYSREHLLRVLMPEAHPRHKARKMRAKRRC